MHLGWHKGRPDAEPLKEPVRLRSDMLPESNFTGGDRDRLTHSEAYDCLSEKPEATNTIVSNELLETYRKKVVRCLRSSCI